MPLTRNLYREDEVLVALQWCILKGRLQESIFWAQEAIDSELTLDLLQTLFYVWMNFAGAAYIPWFYWFNETVQTIRSGTISQEDIQYLVISLAIGIKNTGDSTVFALLGSGFAQHHDQHTGFAILPKSLAYLKGPGRLFATTLKLGKLALAWSFADWQNPEILSIMEEISKEKHSPLERGAFLKTLSILSEQFDPIWKPEWTWFVRALGVAVVGSKEQILFKAPKKEIPIELQIFQTDLKNLVTQREKRLYTVPQDCLYWFTERGSLRVNQTTEDELTNNLEYALEGSSFWDQHLDLLKTDSDREEFYTTYFNSDIPDEWSKADRQKSHGGGSVPIGPVNYRIMLDTTFNRWFRIPSRGIWNGLEFALTNFKEWSNPVNIESEIHKKYSERILIQNSLEPRPVKFEFIAQY